MSLRSTLATRLSAAPFPVGVPALGSGWAGGRYTKRGEEKPIHQGEEESPSPVSGEQIVLFHTRKRGITKELLPGGFAATLSLVVEEEMPPPFVVEDENSSMVLLPRWFAATMNPLS